MEDTMLTFKEFVSELAREDLRLSPAEVSDLTERFSNEVLQMGQLQEDGSMLVPVDCILEAARLVGVQKLTEAAETLQSREMVSMLQSAKTLVRHVSEARERKLRQMVRQFQDEPDAIQSHKQWKQIEKEVFGVDYHD
jgi:hypothetical protein